MKQSVTKTVVLVTVLTVAAVVYFKSATQAQVATTETAAAGAVHGFDYTCGTDAVTLRLLEGEAAELQIAGETLAVTQSPAASGALYMSSARGQGDVSFHTKGDEALLSRGSVDVSCTLVKADAASNVTEDQTAEQAAVEKAAMTLTGTEWQLDSIEGQPVPAGAAATVAFKDGRVSGMGGCNRFNGGYTAGERALSFTPLATTEMACPSPRMELEYRFHGLMAKVDGYAIDDSGALTLKATDQAVLVFRPAAVKEKAE